MRIIVTGDIADWYMEDFSAQKLPETYRTVVESADLAVFNMEGPIVDSPEGKEFLISEKPLRDWFWKSVLRVFNKKQPIVHSSERILEVGKLNPRTVFCLANNHVKDLGRVGLTETLDRLQQAGIPYIGAGVNASEASKHYTTQIDGRTVHVLNVNMVGLKKNGVFVDIYGARKNEYGAHYMTYSQLNDEVARLKQEDSNAVIIVSVHDGRDAALSVEATQIPMEWLKKIRESGATAVVTHHSHYANETDEGGIFFLGDFIFLRPFTDEDGRPGSFVELEIEGDSTTATVHRYTFKNGIPQ